VAAAEGEHPLGSVILTAIQGAADDTSSDDDDDLSDGEPFAFQQPCSPRCTSTAYTTDKWGVLGGGTASSRPASKAAMVTQGPVTSLLRRSKWRRR
jgi:hypothetical protein